MARTEKSLKSKASKKSTKKSTKKDLPKSKSEGEVVADNITKNALERLFHRAGAKRIGGTSYDEMRKFIERKTQKIVEATILFTGYDGRKTVMEEDVRLASEHLERPLLAGLNKNAKTGTKNLKKCKGEPKKEKSEKEERTSSTGKVIKNPKFHPGTVALRKIRKYQKHSDCLLIPKENFKRIVKKMAEDLAIIEDIRFQKGTISLIQLWIEEYIVEIAKVAVLISLHSKRTTVEGKDIGLAFAIEIENY